MEQNRNPESRWDEGDEPFPDNDIVDWADTPAGRRGEPSPHLKPGEKTWVEAEEDRRRAGLPPRYTLPGDPPSPPVLSEPAPAEAGGPPQPSSGLFYPDGRPIPPTHPDHGPMHLFPRQENGSFAAYYYCSKEELGGDIPIDRPPPRRHRKDGLTPERIETFLTTLRATGSVAEAARAAGCSRQAFYNLYDRADAAAFRDAWEKALLTPSMLLASTAFDRAVNGVEHKVFYKGEFVGTQTKYDNRLLIWLLRVRDPLNFAPLDDLQGWLRHRGIEATVPLEPTLDRLAAAEEQWGRRLPGEGEPSARLPAPAGSLEWPLHTPSEEKPPKK